MIDVARLEATLARGRATARARMAAASTVTIRRKTGRTAQDESIGAEAPIWDVTYADLPARLVASRVGGASRGTATGGVEQELSTPRMDFPWDTDDLADEDLVEVTAGEWTGAVYRIVEAVKGDQRTARRVPVEETGRPTEWA